MKRVWECFGAKLRCFVFTPGWNALLPGALVTLFAAACHTSATAGTPGTLRWKFRGDGVGFGTLEPLGTDPALGTDGTLYMGSVLGKTYAFNAASGDVKWISSAAGGGPVTVTHDAIYQIRAGYPGAIRALDPATGTQLWAYPFNAAGGSVALGSNGSIVALGSDNLVALNGATGAKLWEQTSSGAYSPAVAADGTIIGTLRNYQVLEARAASNGAKLWSFGPIINLGAPSIGANGLIYFNVEFDMSASQPDLPGLHALNPATATDQWVQVTEASPSAIGSNGRVYVSQRGGSLMSFDANTGTYLWSARGRGTLSAYKPWPPALGNDDTVYAILDRDGLVAANATTGTVLWEYDAEADLGGAPLIAPDGTLYVGGTDGSVYAIWTSSVGGLDNGPWPMGRKNPQRTASNVPITPAPVIGSQPQNRMVPLGGTLQLDVTVVAPDPLTYSWYHDEVVVASGAGLRSLVVSNATLSVAGAYKVAVSNASGNATSQVATVTIAYSPEQNSFTDGLIARYRLDGNALDLSTNANHGTATATTPVPDHNGQAGGAMHFNGYDSMVTTPASQAIRWVGKTGFTMSAWVKPAKRSVGPQYLIGGPEFSLYIVDGHLGFSLGSVNTPPLPTSTAALSLDTWHHVAAVYDLGASTGHIYIDGALNASAAARPEFIGTAGGLGLGALTGDLSDVRIFRRSLDPAEVEVLWNLGIWIQQQPARSAVFWGQPATLRVQALSAQDITYQWYKNDTAVPGATSATLSFPAAMPSDSGNYSVTLRTTSGAISSATVNLQVSVATLFLSRESEASGGHYVVSLAGQSGRTYRIETTAGLGATSWTPVTTNTLSASPYWSWRDPAPVANTRRFYRAVGLP